MQSAQALASPIVRAGQPGVSSKDERPSSAVIRSRVAGFASAQAICATTWWPWSHQAEADDGAAISISARNSRRSNSHSQLAGAGRFLLLVAVNGDRAAG